jgi:hypothetical protein
MVASMPVVPVTVSGSATFAVCYAALVAIGSLDVQGFMDSPKEAAMPQEVFQEIFSES